MWRRRVLGLAAAAVVVLGAVAAQATSHVRIVRLSYVDGGVQMSRASGEGLDRAILNSPVVEGSRLVTGSNGLAEVEFENNTTVRLGENTEVLFTQLLVNDSGDKVNEVKLLHGTIYFDTHRGKGDIDRVLADGRTFILRRDSQVRFIASGDQVQAAVFNGELRLDNNSDILTAKKKDTITVDASSTATPLIAKGYDELPLDRWNSERAAYQSAYAYNAYGSPGLNGVSYGLQDLGYYGAWTYVSGYGNVWQPYGAFGFSGWNPYMSGAWVYTPGFGYAWSSAYPWGWLPYHYGAWSYLPATGWFWAPGRSFNGGGWQPATTVTSAPVGYRPPVAPIPVTAGPRPTVTVGSASTASMTYLPNGPVPPNFRSVITNHSGPNGVARPGMTAQGGGSSTAVGGSRAVSAAHSNARQNGHVFAPPSQPTIMPSMGVGSSMPQASVPMGAGSPGMGSSPAMGRSATGVGHTGGTSSGNSGGRASSPANPK